MLRMRNRVTRAQCLENAERLNRAAIYLWESFQAEASTRERGFMLPNQQEAMKLLNDASFRWSVEALSELPIVTAMVGCWRANG